MAVLQKAEKLNNLTLCAKWIIFLDHARIHTYYIHT